jgi:hypothetical protein
MGSVDHEFKEDEQWGDPPTIPSSFDEIMSLKKMSNGEIPLLFQALLMTLVITNIVLPQQHSYFQHQDSNSTDDVIDQCVFASHSSPSAYESDNIVFYNACDTEILDTPTLSQTIIPKTTVKQDPDFQKLQPLFGWLLLISFRKLLNI